MTASEIDAIWRRFLPMLRQTVRARVDRDADADDVLQEVLLRVHASLGCLRDSGKLAAWLCQIARNAAMDHHRRRPREMALAKTDVAQPDPDAEDAAARLAPYVRELLDALPAPYREALILADMEGLGQKEVAARQGLSLSGAKSRVQRARQKLRDLLLACCHLELDRRGRLVDYWEHCCCCAEKTVATDRRS